MFFEQSNVRFQALTAVPCYREPCLCIRYCTYSLQQTHNSDFISNVLHKAIRWNKFTCLSLVARYRFGLYRQRLDDIVAQKPNLQSCKVAQVSLEGSLFLLVCLTGSIPMESRLHIRILKGYVRFLIQNHLQEWNT